MLNYVLFYILEMALQLGTLFNTKEALEIGLVDQIADDLESATKAAEVQLKEFLQIPSRLYNSIILFWKEG